MLPVNPSYIKTIIAIYCVSFSKYSFSLAVIWSSLFSNHFFKSIFIAVISVIINYIL